MTTDIKLTSTNIADAYNTAMRYPKATPLQFSGAQAFVEIHGNAVWADFCDSMPTDEVLRVSDVAAKLSTLADYALPARYLRAVLQAVLADYNERPDDYEHKPPFTRVGKRMAKIIL
jgi:hypothetical protein